jgi:hypothetical protein
LDREIVAGLPIEGSEARLLRAEQLLSPGARRAVAAVLRTILDVAEDADVSGCSYRRRDAAAIIASHGRLTELIDLLRSDTPMALPAVAGAELLACDRHSPLVCGHDAAAIARALDEIAAPRGGLAATACGILRPSPRGA